MAQPVAGDRYYQGIPLVLGKGRSLRSRTTGGITLIECIASIAIVGTAVVAGLELFGHHQEMAVHDESAWGALRILGNESERIRTEHYDQLQATAFSSCTDDPSYEVRYLIEQTTATCRTVTVEVRWLAEPGRYNIRSLKTIRCEGVD